MKLKFWIFHGVPLRVLRFFLLTLAATVVAYVVFAVFFSTDVEKELSAENRMYSELLPQIQQENSRRADALAFLQHRDNAIYELVFHSGAPGINLLDGNSGDFPGVGLSADSLISFASSKSDSLVSAAVRVDSLFLDIFSQLGKSGARMPMLMPVRKISYPQVGAGFGKKMSPFLKALVQHDGLDLIMERGDTVYATSGGVVDAPSVRTKNDGNILEIHHSSGYVTRYSHLQDILVRQGQRVEAGQAVATIGMTGKSYSPHLHYELSRDGEPCDPMNHIFASITPEDYLNMLFLSENTIQSMD